jgi:hypothetical protein
MLKQIVASTHLFVVIEHKLNITNILHTFLHIKIK